jgi:hypothetical protein
VLCHSSLRYGEWKVISFDVGWPITLGKSLSHKITALSLRFMGGVAFVPQLGMPVVVRLPGLTWGRSISCPSHWVS